MMKNIGLTEIRGIGPATAKVFKNNGFSNIEDLASASLADVMKIPGFREARATQVISSAQMMLVVGASVDGSGRAEQEKPQKTKKKTKKKAEANKKKKKDKPKKKNKSVKKKQPKKNKTNKKKGKKGKAKKTKK